MPPMPERAGDGGGWWPPVLLIWTGVVVLTLVVMEAPAALRAAPVIGYVMTVPGLAWVRLVHPPGRLAELALAVGLSLALAVAAAQAMIYLDLWSPALGMGALVTIASVASGAELLQLRRSGRAAAPPDGAAGR